MNPAKMKRDLSRVTRRELRKAPNGQAVQVEVASRQAIRDSYPMNTKGESAKDKDLYHKMKYLAAGMTELSFFNAQVNGPNGAGGSIGYDVTNMEKAGEMAKGKDFFLEGIDVIPQPTAAAEADRLADLTKLLNSGRLVLLDSDQKEIFSVFPLRRVVSDLTFSGIDTTHGNADERDPFMLANPINIEEGQRFTVNIDFPGVAPVLTADTYLTVVLLGQEHKAAISQ